MWRDKEADMKQKIQSRKGETLVEVLAALLVVIFIIAMLPMSLETAARINAKVKDMPTICPKSPNGTPEAMTVTISANGATVETVPCTGHTEDGFAYYGK